MTDIIIDYILSYLIFITLFSFKMKKKINRLTHTHTHTIIFTFALGDRHESTVTGLLLLFSLLRIQNDPPTYLSKEDSLLSSLHGYSSVHAGSATSDGNWGTVYIILASCPSAPVFCLCCCHWVRWLLKWYKETTLLVVTVVSGSGRAILLLSHGQA